MDVTTAILSRRSVRAYTGAPVEAGKLERIIANGNAAPVALGAFDHLMMTLIEDPWLLARIDALGAARFGRPNMHPLYGAPQLIVVSAHIERPELANAMLSSAAMVVHNMTLTAVDLGVGACCIWGAVSAIPDDPKVLRALRLPQDFSPCCALALGEAVEPVYTPRDDVAAGRIPLTRLVALSDVEL